MRMRFVSPLPCVAAKSTAELDAVSGALRCNGEAFTRIACRGMKR